MALSDYLTQEKNALTTLLTTEYPTENLREQLLTRLYFINSLLGENSGGGGSTAPSFSITAQNFGANNAGVYKSTAGSLFSLYIKNINAATRYFLIIDKATTPVNGDTPLHSFTVPANGLLFVDTSLLGSNGISCTTGIAWAFSTTEAIVTLASASDLSSFAGIQ